MITRVSVAGVDIQAPNSDHVNLLVNPNILTEYNESNIDKLRDALLAVDFKLTKAELKDLSDLCDDIENDIINLVEKLDLVTKDSA